jgi:hypothetical protein
MLVAQYAALANKHGVPIITVGCGKGCKFSISYDILPPGAKNSTQAGRIISAIAFSQMISHDLAVHYGLEPGSSKINTKW